MTRFTPLLTATLLVLAAAGGAILAVSLGTPSRDEAGRAGGGSGNVAPPQGAPATSGGSSTAAPAGSGAVASTPPSATAPTMTPSSVARAGRVLPLDDAIRELDLIRPSRHKVAEDFTLPMPGGGSFRLSDQRGKTVLVNFWATWCPPCREEMPAMERLYQRHKDRGLVLVAVSIDADPAVVPAYLKASKLTFPVALDPKAEVANKYGVRALPSSFVVDRAGTMTALALGPRAWDNDASHSLVEALAK